MPAGGGVDIGTLSGKVEFEDRIGSTLDNIVKNVTKGETAFSGMGKAVFAAAGVATVAAVAYKVASVAIDNFFASFGRADKIVDMSSKFDVSTDAIQRWGYVAQQTGTQAESFGNATLKLGINIASGSQKIRSALSELGIGFETIRTLKPEQQFELVAGKLGMMSDSQERARLSLILMGKGAKDVLPAIAEGYADIASNAEVAGEAQVRQLAAAADAWDGFTKNASTKMTSFAGNVVIWFDTLITTQAEWEREFRGIASNSKDPMMSLIGVQETYVEQLKKTTANVSDLTDQMLKEIHAGKELGVTEDEIAKKLHLTTEEVSMGIEAWEKRTDVMKKNADMLKKVGDELQAIADEKARKFNDALIELTNAEISWQKQLESLDGTIVEAVHYYLGLGVEIEKLKIVYGLTDEQVKALNKSFEVQNDLAQKNKEAAKAQADAWAELNGMGQEHTNVLAGIGDRTIADIENYIRMGASLATLQTAYGLTDAQIKAVAKSLEDSDDKWKNEHQNVKKATDLHKTLNGELITQEELQRRRSMGGSFDVTSQNFEKAFTDFSTFNGFLPGGRPGFNLAEAFKMAEKGYSFQEIIQIMANKQSGAGGPIPPPQGPRIPGFIDGGIGDFGSGTLAMLHGEEAIVPLDQAGALGNVTNVFYVNGTAADVARQVSDHIMRSLKRHRHFGAA